MSWTGVAGLEEVKKTLLAQIDISAIVSCKGVLLYGPAGCGKTVLAKAIESETKASFVRASASELLSKHLDGQQLVHDLFSTARSKQPCILFIDDLDLFVRMAPENRPGLMSEVMDQLEQSATDRILLLATAQKPWVFSTSALKHMSTTIFLGLPNCNERFLLLESVAAQFSPLSPQQLLTLAKATEGFSPSDLVCLCRHAAMSPLSSIPLQELLQMSPFSEMPPVVFEHFLQSAESTKPTITAEGLVQYERWRIP